MFLTQSKPVFSLLSFKKCLFLLIVMKLVSFLWCYDLKTWINVVGINVFMKEKVYFTWKSLRFCDKGFLAQRGFELTPVWIISMPIWKFGFKHHPIAQWDSAREGCGRSRVQSPVSPMIFFFPQILHLSKSQITFVIVGSNPIFPHTKWVKTLVKIFKDRNFQKMLKMVWFSQKIRNFYVQIQVIGK